MRPAGVDVLSPESSVTSPPEANRDQAEALRRKVAELTELAGGLAHELRNPLSTVMLNLQLLAEDLQDGQARPEDVRRRALLRVNLLRREAERLQGLFDEFLRLAGTWSLQATTIDVRAIIHRLVEFLEPLLHAHKINIALDMPDAPVTCAADEKLLSQALLNLAINAQQAMPDGGTLHVRIRAEPPCITIAVADTGVGIPAHDFDRILRPFYSTKSGGTGLGLPLTKRIIEEHGGELTFSSHVGKGTEFVIRLPAARFPHASAS